MVGQAEEAAMDWDLDWDDVAEAFIGAMLAHLVLWFAVMPALAKGKRRRGLRLRRG